MAIAAIATGFAGHASDDTFARRVDVIARRSLDRPNAGLSIAVARDGTLILARGYGVADRARAVAVTPDSIFHIASISKNIAAAAVLSLVDRGSWPPAPGLITDSARAWVHFLVIASWATLARAEVSRRFLKISRTID
ncbi:beta-lactamase/D-alanine carboxypeptidase [Luteitalea pratensis]|uniref:Beta-lactamase/D-alanine carboxypeptidase n=1 Tax=Luteitalea pratensis TaxID=1855912 RepID=A0A143PJR8_LUTPR|nr:serine hydrolase domain-containing protein [Luteitalea pratensis]AMY08308.1 beta-lactamase/D-alanine carboxypeptidase [Luteitalea pratensis]